MTRNGRLDATAAGGGGRVVAVVLFLPMERGTIFARWFALGETGGRVQGRHAARCGGGAGATSAGWLTMPLPAPRVPAREFVAPGTLYLVAFRVAFPLLSSQVGIFVVDRATEPYGG